MDYMGAYSIVVGCVAIAALIIAILALVKTQNPNPVTIVRTSTDPFVLPDNANNNTVSLQAPVGVTPNIVQQVTLPDTFQNGSTMTLQVQDGSKAKITLPAGFTQGGIWSGATEWFGVSLLKSPVFLFAADNKVYGFQTV